MVGAWDWLAYGYAALRSFAIAHRRSSARLSLVVEPFLQGSNPTTYI